MRARRIIEGASFGPEVVKVASDAFEAAWAEIAARFDPSMHEAVRENLAQVTSRRRGKTAAMLSCFALVACGFCRVDQLVTGQKGTEGTERNTIP